VHDDDDNDKPIELFNMVNRSGAHTLVPLGDISATELGVVIYPQTIRKSKGSFFVIVDGNEIEIEAIGEGEAAPMCKEENIKKAELVLADSWLFVALRLSDEEGIDDENLTAIRLNVALKIYPGLVGVVYDQLEKMTREMDVSVSVFLISKSELKQFPKLENTNVFCYSENNLLIPDSWAKANLDCESTWYEVPYFWGPKRPTRDFKFFGMWLADMLDYQGPGDKPNIYEAPIMKEGMGKGGKGKGKGKMFMSGWKSADYMQEPKEDKKEEPKEDKKESANMGGWVDELLEASSGAKKSDDVASLAEADLDEAASMPMSPSRVQPTPGLSPSSSSQSDLLQKLKFDISQKFPEFTFLVQIERFPFMSRGELMQEIQETQAKANEVKLKLAGNKRKRTVRLDLYLFIPLIQFTNPHTEPRVPQPAVPPHARVRDDQDALRHPDLLRRLGLGAGL